MRNRRDKVWIRKSDGHLGMAMVDTFFGDLWVFKPFKDDEVISEKFCIFLADTDLTREDFIDLGEL